MHDKHLINVLGAGSLAIADLIGDSVTESSRTSRSGAAALAVLAQTDALSVTELGRRVHLSQPAAARMVTTLEEAGYVSRRAGHGREMRVHLSESGSDTARKLLRSRSRQLARVVRGLDADEQHQLAVLLGRVVANVYDDMPAANVICRLCDRRECVSTAARCPVGVAAGEAPDG